jgi:hypothetical protein
MDDSGKKGRGHGKIFREASQGDDFAGLFSQ